MTSVRWCVSACVLTSFSSFTGSMPNFFQKSSWPCCVSTHATNIAGAHSAARQQQHKVLLLEFAVSQRTCAHLQQNSGESGAYTCFCVLDVTDNIFCIFMSAEYVVQTAVTFLCLQHCKRQSQSWACCLCRCEPST